MGIFNFRKTCRIGSFELHLNTWIILILILSAVISFYNITNVGLSSWDEATYAYAAKKVIEGNLIYLGAGFKPLHIVFTTIGNLIFGVHDYSGVIISGIFGLLTVYVTFLIGRLLLSEKVGLSAALVLAVSRWHIYFAKSQLPDMLATLLFSITILFYIYSINKKKVIYQWLTAILALACFFTRMNAGIVLAIIGIMELIRWIKKKTTFKEALQRNWKMIALPLLIMVFFVFLYNYLGSMYLPGFTEAQTGKAEGFLSLLNPQMYNFRYYLKSIIDLMSPFTMILLILGLIFLPKKRSISVLSSWFLFLFIFLSIFPSHRLKLFVPALPVICIFAAKGITEFRKKWVEAAVLILVIASSLYISYDTITMQSTTYRQVSDYITGADKIINSHQGIYMYYLDDQIGRDNLYRLQDVKNKAELKALYDKGYDYIILDDRGYDAPLRRILIKSEPVYRIINPAWKKDLLIVQENRLVPFLTEKDREIRPWVGIRNSGDNTYGYIYVYEIKTFI